MASNTSASNATGTRERFMGRSVHYDISYIVQGIEHGTDGAIVLLHDIPAGAFTWEPVMGQLAGLNRAVYAFDMLGYGQSDHPWPADTSVWGHADVLALLFKDLNLTNIVLVGHGLGGGVAQILATRLYREQTSALVLVDSVAYLHAFAENWPLTEMEKRRDFDAPQNTSVEDLIQNLRETLPGAVVNTKGFGDVLNDYVEPWNNELGKEVLFQHLRGLVPFYLNSVSTDLQKTGQPTLLIWGQQDKQTPVKLAERLHREIPGSILAILPNAGHMALFDDPNAVATALSDFITKL
ncbi:MAG: alpha/beta hydrolase [Ktedonobacteraceae bacterium]